MTVPITIRGSIDPKAIDQLILCSQTGNAIRAAMSADGHYGYSQPVGGAVAYVDHISPSGVGYDIGCVDEQTEYLTRDGWVHIADYNNGEEIMQYDPETGIGSFVTPDAYIIKPCNLFLHFKTKYGIDQMVDETHRMLVWKQKGGRRYSDRLIPIGVAMAGGDEYDPYKD